MNIENIIINAIFFIVILIIMLLIYYKIHRDIKLSRLKGIAEKYSHEVKIYGKSLEQKRIELDTRFDEVSNQTFDMIKTINSQLAEIKEYKADLIKLQDAMATYQEALNRLSQLTVQINEKTEMIKVKAEALEAVENKINKQSEKVGELENMNKALEAQMGENAEAMLNKQQELSEQLIEKNIEQVKEDYKTVEVSAKTHIFNLEKQIKETEIVTLALTDKAGPLLVECADRYAVLANEQTEIRRMNEEKKDLIIQLEELKKEKELLNSLIAKDMNPEEVNQDIQEKVDEEFEATESIENDIPLD